MWSACGWYSNVVSNLVNNEVSMWLVCGQHVVQYVVCNLVNNVVSMWLVFGQYVVGTMWFSMWLVQCGSV